MLRRLGWLILCVGVAGPAWAQGVGTATAGAARPQASSAPLVTDTSTPGVSASPGDDTGSTAATAVAPTPATAAVEASAEPRSVPTASEAPNAAEPATDHERVVGRLGLGWGGAPDLAVGTLDRTIAAPSLAARYWRTARFGMELGVGLSYVGATTAVQQPGSTSTERVEPTLWGFSVRLAAPIALSWGRHYTLVVIPETRIGWATVGARTAPDEESDDGGSGLTFELGARAGAELHFGFLGVPELALEATVGLALQAVSVSTTDGNTGTKASRVSIATTAYDAPWDFFRTAVAARYYF